MEVADKDLINEGNHYVKIGEYDKAIECYDKALKINPKYLSSTQ